MKLFITYQLNCEKKINIFANARQDLSPVKTQRYFFKEMLAFIIVKRTETCQITENRH